MPERYFQRYGDTFATSFLGQKMVMTRQPEVIQDALIRKASSFSKDKGTQGLSRLLGQGLLTSDGATWREHRRALQPHFQPKELESYANAFLAEANREQASWQDSDVIDMHEAMTRLTMRIALKTLFGANPDHFGSFEAIMSPAMLYFEGVAGTQSPLPPWIPTPTNRRFVQARAELRKRLGDIMESARREGSEETLLARLLAANESKLLSDEQVIDESITMLVAGHETSALTLCYALHLLAEHPLAQSRLHREVKEQGVPATVQESQGALQLKNVLTECLRLYPVTWVLGREAVEDVRAGGYFLKKGTQVYVHQWQAHRHPDYFENPERFFPDRWTGEFTSALPKALYAPFGAGPRICIGHHFALMEMSLILATLVQNFEFTRHTTAPLRFRTSITARPRDPLLLRVRRRA